MKDIAGYWEVIFYSIHKQELEKEFRVILGRKIGKFLSKRKVAISEKRKQSAP